LPAAPAQLRRCSTMTVLVGFDDTDATTTAPLIYIYTSQRWQSWRIKGQKEDFQISMALYTGWSPNQMFRQALTQAQPTYIFMFSFQYFESYPSLAYGEHPWGCPKLKIALPLLFCHGARDIWADFTANCKTIDVFGPSSSRPHLPVAVSLLSSLSSTTPPLPFPIQHSTLHSFTTLCFRACIVQNDTTLYPLGVSYNTRWNVELLWNMERRQINAEKQLLLQTRLNEQNSRIARRVWALQFQK